MESLKLFLNVTRGCRCYVARDESGAIAYHAGECCENARKSHDALIARLTERLERIRKEGN